MVRIGTDTIFSIALYRHDGEIGTSPDPDVADVIDPHTLESIEAEIRTDCGGIESIKVQIEGKLLKVEITQELTERLNLGLYKLRLKVREADTHFADGYRDVTLLTELCQVVSDGADAGLPKANISVAVSQLATGKSAYESYLETTKDNPKLSEEEWVASLTGDSAYEDYLKTTTDNPKKTLPEWLASFKGDTGDSAYEDYLKTTTDNPKKTLPEWLASFKGDTGDSAYEDYLKTTTDNPKKTLPEWLASLKGDKGDSAYDVYVATTSDSPKKSREEWLSSLDGVNGKSAYQSYLDTTKDEPKMTEEEWASNGWLIMLETLKKLRGTKR